MRHFLNLGSEILQQSQTFLIVIFLWWVNLDARRITRGSWLQSSDGKTYFKGTVNRYSGTRATVERGLHYCPRAIHNKVPQTGWLKQPKCIVSQLWGLKYKIKGHAVLLKSGGKDLFQASLLASANSLLWQHHSSLYRVFSLCVCVFPNFPSLGRYQSFWLRALSTSVWPHLNSWHLAYFLVSLHSKLLEGFPGSTSGKEFACQCKLDVRDSGLIPGMGRSPEGGHRNPPHYFCLENPMDRRAWRATIQGLHRVGHEWSDWAWHSHWAVGG